MMIRAANKSIRVMVGFAGFIWFDFSIARFSGQTSPKMIKEGIKVYSRTKAVFGDSNHKIVGREPRWGATAEPPNLFVHPKRFCTRKAEKRLKRLHKMHSLHNLQNVEPVENEIDARKQRIYGFLALKGHDFKSWP
jgi:hypothetical protein